VSSGSGARKVLGVQTYDPQSFDCLAEAYDAATSLERNHDFFIRHLPEHRGRVLDLGCGTGLLAFELSKRFDTVTAIDISGPMLAIARRKRAAANVEYHQADANRLALDETFDAIVSHTTFHHLENIPETLSRLKAALAPGGRLILIDLIDRWPKIMRQLSAFYITATCAAFPRDALRHGPGGACCLLRFRVSRSWLEHLKSDLYLSEAEFRELYGRNLPGASFTRLRYFMGVVWQSTSNVAGKDTPFADADIPGKSHE
jgi:ubiquinone/menaquinone biosynthesis C-methylase UbiE